MAKALITTVPFGDKNPRPFECLSDAQIEYVINPLGKKLTEDELISLIPDFDSLIAGTEVISEKVMKAAPKLKFISRVGIGLDGVDLTAAKARNIQVSYTPDAPAPAVAELAIGHMLSLLRSLHVSNEELHEGIWKRHFGRRIEEVKVGIIGAGRIGKRVIDHLSGFNCNNILVNDLVEKSLGKNAKFVSKEKIYQEADIISLHLPLNPLTKNLITSKELKQMKENVVIINTSRGGIINENDLYNALVENPLMSAGVDVFEVEPYHDKLSRLKNCFLTAHMGSMSVDCRTKMEIEATEEIVRFFKGEKLLNAVPDYEFEMHKLSRKDEC